MLGWKVGYMGTVPDDEVGYMGAVLYDKVGYMYVGAMHEVTYMYTHKHVDTRTDTYVDIHT